MLLLIAMILVGGSAWADEEKETLVLNTVDGIAAVTKTSQGSNASVNGVQGGNVVLSQGNVTVNADLSYFKGSGSDGIQVYKNGSMTVSVPVSKKITKITLTYASSCYPFAETPDYKIEIETNGKTKSQCDAIYSISGSVNSTTFTNNANGQTKVKKIVVTYDDSGVEEIKVSGVSLSETSKTITEGESFTLAASVAPANASNKNVAWSSSDEAVAKVDKNGEVVSVAPGTATITVKTIDGNYTASCAVTVTKAEEPEELDEYLFLFAANGSDSDNGTAWSKTSELNKVFAEGYKYISSITATNNVYPARNSLVNGVKFGNSSTAGSISFELKKPVPATYIIVSAAAYGDAEGQQGFTINGTSVDMSAAQNKVYCEYAIKLDGSDLSTITLSQNAANKGRIYVESIKVLTDDDVYYPKRTLKLTAKSDGVYYGTFSSTNGVCFDGAEGVTVSYVGVEDGSLVTYDNEIAFALGDEISKDYDLVYGVPANTGVLIRSTEQLVTYYSAEFDEEVPSTPCIDYNMLRPATEAMTGNYKFYKLAYDVYTKDSKTDLGFYYGAEDGAAFTCKAGLAYLAVPAASAAKSFVLGAPATAIKSVNTTSSSAIYNLAGQRLSQPQKGINIVDGKKVLVK